MGRGAWRPLFGLSAWSFKRSGISIRRFHGNRRLASFPAKEQPRYGALRDGFSSRIEFLRYTSKCNAFNRLQIRCIAGSCNEPGAVDDDQQNSVSAVEDESVLDDQKNSSAIESGNEEHKEPDNVEVENAECKEESFRASEKEREAKNREEEEAAFQVLKSRFRKEFESRIVSYEDIKVSLDKFPHYLDSTTRDLLENCATAHLRQPEFMEYSQGLPSSSQRILLHGPPGSELYQEDLVKALAHHLKASFLSLDGSILSPCDYGDQDFSMESEYDNEDEDSEARWHSNDSEQDASDEDQDGSDNEEPYRICALLEVAEANFKHKHGSEMQKASAGSSGQEETSASQFKLKKGDRVRFVGSPESRVNKKRQAVKKGQRGWVVSTPKGLSNNVGVRFVNSDKRPEHSSSKGCEETPTSFVNWCHLTELELDDGPVPCPADEWVAALEALREIASGCKNLVIYFPDPQMWFERAVPLAQRQDFLEQVEERLDRITGPVILIAAKTSENGEFDRRVRLVVKSKWRGRELSLEDIYDLFVNTIDIHPPEEEKQFAEWKERLERDKALYNSRRSLQRLQKVLDLHNLECENLSELNLSELNLSPARVEKVVGWALNHHLGTCSARPCTLSGKLSVPLESFQKALTLLKAQEDRKTPPPPPKDFNSIAEDEYEKSLISCVIPSTEVGVMFKDVGALENVKKALQELVVLPLQRPELFRRGNLTKPCRGVLLFGPPGTGKTLLAKAVATEAGANFINITSSTISSKWFGDAEKLTRALFSLARKLSPAVIFVDEVDSLLGTRGGSSEHEVTRRVKNEFMAAWDGLRTKDDERILVLAATNRPFDLDDAVIRRLPRRILIDLPQVSSRAKILGAILAKEKLEEGFDVNELARMTEGYSGSDLKNLSVAAAYRPIREFLEKENELKEKVEKESVDSVIRSIQLADFRQAMTQVGASVAYDALSMNELRHWNEQYGEGGSRKKKNFGFSI